VQAAMTVIGIGATVIVGVSAIADRRRQRRGDLDRVGFMPWPLISLLATIVALFAFALSLRSAG
jgi:hypothetical protein